MYFVGTINIPASLPSSAPLMYNLNVNTQAPVLAVSSKQPSSATVPIGE